MTTSGRDRPPVFQALAFRDALTQAQAEDRWLLVDATAGWCQPCKQMDRTTWRDVAVVSWIEDHALAIQVDVDAEEDLARELAVQAMPTVIAFKDGAERDRVSGYRGAAAVLGWLAGLERGETSIDQLRRSVTDPQRDMQGRLRLAQALLGAGKRAEATEELVWLWDNIARVEPDMEGVRVSFMAGNIEQLVREHEPAMQRFTEIRDRAGSLADGVGPSAVRVRFDWIVLNEILGDQDRTMEWFDAVKDDSQYAPFLERSAHRLVPLLASRDRLADIGRLYTDPVAQLVQQHEQLQPPPDLASKLPDGVPAEILDQVRDMFVAQFRSSAALLFASLRAAGRAADAEALEREAIRLDPSDSMRRALDAAQAKLD